MNTTYIIAVVATLLTVRVPAQGPVAPASIDAAFDRVIPDARESRWRLLRWRRSLHAALDEARRVNKPVYYFGADGDFFAGNC